MTEENESKSSQVAEEENCEVVLGWSLSSTENEFCPASVQECTKGNLKWDQSGTVYLELCKETGSCEINTTTLSGRATSLETSTKNSDVSADQNYILVREDGYWRLEKVDLSVVHLRPHRNSHKSEQKPGSSAVAHSKATPIRKAPASMPNSPKLKGTVDSQRGKSIRLFF
eukprot:jgi/Galph1/943/GphlegSOOS_G5635.1